MSDATTLIENGEGRNGRTVTFSPKTEQTRDDDLEVEVETEAEAESGLKAIATSKKRTGFVGQPFGLLLTLLWFGEIGLACVVALSDIWVSMARRTGLVGKQGHGEGKEPRSK